MHLDNCSHLVVVLKILPHLTGFMNYRNVVFSERIRRTNARQLQYLRGLKSTGTQYDFVSLESFTGSVAQRDNAGRLFVCKKYFLDKGAGNDCQILPVRDGVQECARRT